MPAMGWKTYIFFAIMAIVGLYSKFSGIEIPPEIAEKLTQDQIDLLINKGTDIYYWITIVGGFFFRSITKSAPFKTE